jgi:ribose transport system ATP-binding protein
MSVVPGRGEPPGLVVRNLSKAFSSGLVLSELDFEVRPGEVHALLGGNGSGKSTFIKILSGFHRPEAGGQVFLSGQEFTFGSPAAAYRAGVRVVHQDLRLVNEISVLDNLFLAAGFPARLGTVRQRFAVREARRELARYGLEIDPRAIVRDLPLDSRTAVAIVRALRDDSDHPARLLILDEPTATMPETEVSELLGIVRRVAASGVGVIYVSHRLQEALDVADVATVLRDGKKIAHESIKQVTKQRLVELITGSDVTAQENVELSSGLGASVVLSATGITTAALREVSLEARAGEILGIAGISGSGRELLLGSLAGAYSRTAGSVSLGDRDIPNGRPDVAARLGLAFVPADRKTHGGIMSLTARENLTLADLSAFGGSRWFRHRAEQQEAQRWFETLRVSPRNGTELPLGKLSGGNQQKVVLAKWLRCHPSALLLDEPTQGVDVGVKAEIHAELRKVAKAGAAVLVSSSDIEELAMLCNRVLVIREGSVVTEINHDDLTPATISRYTLSVDGALACDI